MELKQVLFYTLLTLGAVLVIIPAYLTYQKDKNAKFSFAFLLISIIGTIISSINSCNSNHDSLQSSLKATYNDSLYKDLLIKNYNKAVKITENQNISLDSTKEILIRSKGILESQNKFSLLQDNSIKILSKQIDSASQILSLNRKFDKVQKEINGKANRLISVATSDDSLVVVDYPTISVKDSTLNIDIFNKGQYPISANIVYADQIGKGTFSKDITLPGNAAKNLYKHSIKGVSGNYYFWFQVNWNNHIIKYLYKILIMKGKCYVLDETHFDIYAGKYFRFKQPGYIQVFLDSKK